jgi:hypothetical protein
MDPMDRGLAVPQLREAITPRRRRQNLRYPRLSLALADECYFPKGTSTTVGYTLEADYQVLENGMPVSGTLTLNALGVVVSELVTTTNGPTINPRGPGVWCPVGGSCDTAGSMSSSGSFWDTLAGDPSRKTSTADQSFFLQGAYLPVVSFPGGPTVLHNTYSTGIVTLNGMSATPRACGRNGDPTP